MEYQATEEYKTSERHSEIIRTYEETKTEFEAKYGKNTYNCCYDVFGVLRNEPYLKDLKSCIKLWPFTFTRTVVRMMGR